MRWLWFIVCLWLGLFHRAYGDSTYVISGDCANMVAVTLPDSVVDTMIIGTVAKWRGTRVKLGDVNADSNVNTADIIYLVNYVLKGLEPPRIDSTAEIHMRVGSGRMLFTATKEQESP